MVLREGIDWGRVPGVPQPFLWDPGASQIISAFRCHPGERRLLHLIDDGEKIAVIVEVPIISNESQQKVASGIAAASTQEVKHKYRWVKKPLEWGFTEEAVKDLKTRTDNGIIEYRIPNPEHSELLHIIITQASKRAEVDAAKTLPGVASALRELFIGKKYSPGYKDQSSAKTTQDSQEGAADIDLDSPRWTKFWAAVKDIFGDDYARKTREALGVKSVKDWLRDGKTLDDAIEILAEKYGQKAKEASARAQWDKVKKEDVSTYPKLEKKFTELTGKDASSMYLELGGGSREDMAIPAWDAFLQLKTNLPPE